jgi:hypothetical protein
LLAGGGREPYTNQRLGLFSSDATTLWHELQSRDGLAIRTGILFVIAAKAPGKTHSPIGSRLQP